MVMTDLPKALYGLDDDKLREVRARERTFDGAYWRSTLKAFVSGIVVLKIFSREFYKIGMVYIALGVGFLLISILRRRSFHRSMDECSPFKTCGKYVILTSILSISAYMLLLVFLLELKD